MSCLVNVLYSGTVICSTLSVKRHFETKHKSVGQKSESDQKKIIAIIIINTRRLLLNMLPKMLIRARQVTRLLMSLLGIVNLFKMKRFCLCRNTVKERILNLAQNATDQQKIDINSTIFVSLS